MKTRIRVLVGTLMGATLGFLAGFQSGRHIQTARGIPNEEWRRGLEMWRMEAAIHDYELQYGRVRQPVPHPRSDLRGSEARERTN
jgi:hypothetical protein